MKTLHDYLTVVCGGDKRSLYNKPKSLHDFSYLTLYGRMIYISVDMLYEGKY